MVIVFLRTKLNNFIISTHENIILILRTPSQPNFTGSKSPINKKFIF